MTDIINISNRKIGIHEYGDRHGIPVFYFHGFPGSRLDGELLDFNRPANGSFRVIGIDRPGIGLSDYQPGRKLLDWSADVAGIADALGIDKFRVVGFSGGGPYALACAYGIPHRTRSAGFISGMGPIEYKEARSDNAMFIPKRMPIIRRLIASTLYKGITRNPDKIVRYWIRLLPKADREFLFADSNTEKMQLLFSENFKQGVNGFLKEAEIYREPWGFKLTEIKIPVDLWHGTADRNISIKTAKRISNELVHCKTHFIKNEGHFSLPAKYLGEILRGLESNDTAI